MSYIINSDNHILRTDWSTCEYLPFTSLTDCQLKYSCICDPQKQSDYLTVEDEGNCYYYPGEYKPNCIGEIYYQHPNGNPKKLIYISPIVKVSYTACTVFRCIASGIPYDPGTQCYELYYKDASVCIIDNCSCHFPLVLELNCPIVVHATQSGTLVYKGNIFRSVGLSFASAYLATSYDYDGTANASCRQLRLSHIPNNAVYTDGSGGVAATCTCTITLSYAEPSYSYRDGYCCVKSYTTCVCLNNDWW